MRLALNSKQQQIVDDLSQIDRELQKINFVRNEFQSRRLVDCRRQLLANLKALQSVNKDNRIRAANLITSRQSSQLSE